MSETMFDVHDWFWIVGDNNAKAWSSAADKYVDTWPASRVTRIKTDEELTAVLSPYGLMGPTFNPELVWREVNRRIDVVASPARRTEMAALRAADLMPVTPQFDGNKAFVNGLGWVHAMRTTGQHLIDGAVRDYHRDAHWPTCPPDVVALFR